MLIIYNKVNGRIVENTGKNSAFPLGIEDASFILENVIANNGGVEEDYGLFRLHDIEDSENVEKTSSHNYSIQDGRIVFGELKPIPESEPQPPTEIELIQQENAMLQMSMMEMTMYAATQDVRLQGQEQAILELSMIVAGGGL